MALLSWERYCSLHSEVNEGEFEKAEAIAEKEVARVIGPIRWATVLSGTDLAAQLCKEQLLDCIANLIDYDATVAKKLGTGVASVSNDGYSESYNTEAQMASAATAEKDRNIRAWLSGTGLVGAY